MCWGAMLNRCYNENQEAYARYGGRGIKVCDRWRGSFTNFLSDMGVRPSRAHTLERDNPFGDYEPSNCRWATRVEQSNNTRGQAAIAILAGLGISPAAAFEAGYTRI